MKIILLYAIVVITVPSPAFGDAQFSVTELFYPYGGTGNAAAINNAGTIIDEITDPTTFSDPMGFNSVLLRGVSVQPINAAIGQNFSPNAINDEDEVVGTATTLPPSYPIYSAVFYGGGNTLILPNPFASIGSTFCQSVAINNSNQIVGNALGTEGQLQAIEWPYLGAGAMILAPNIQMSVASSINDAGTVAGFVSYGASTAMGVPVIWQSNGIMQSLNLPEGAGGAEASKINNNNQVLCVGFFAVPGTDVFRVQYYVWDNGNTTPLAFPGGQTIGFPDDVATQALDMNDSGVVVGVSDHCAVMWINGVVTDLNTLIDPNSGWTLIAADSINDAGDIVGTGEYDGQNVPFLLTPDGNVSIPEPAMISLAADSA